MSGRTATAALPLHFDTLGSAGDWVLLLHGLFGSGDNLGGLARHLAAEFRVALVDLRNHGRSPHSEVMDLPALAADIAALQDRLGAPATALVGHSLGGKVAMQLALTEPQRVSRLVVADIAPVAYPPGHRQILAGLQALELTALADRRAADAELAAWVPEQPVRQFLLKSLYRDERGLHWRFHLPALARCYDALRAAPAGRPFGGPTLFIKGEHSGYITAEHRAAIEATFPAFQFRMIANTGHWLHGEKPAAFNRLVLQFLRGQ
jgi:esterase